MADAPLHRSVKLKQIACQILNTLIFRDFRAAHRIRAGVDARFGGNAHHPGPSALHRSTSSNCRATSTTRLRWVMASRRNAW